MPQRLLLKSLNKKNNAYPKLSFLYFSKLFLKPTTVILFGILLYGCSSGRFANYVTANKNKLMDGDKELRFVSFNIPNLHYIEDDLYFNNPNPWRLPDEFEIRDALTAIKQMDGKVTRMYVLSVRKQGESKNIIRHVEAPGVFNEEAFRTIDKVLQVANEIGIRVIIPFVDNWIWWGGPLEYASFRGKAKEEFWTDPQLISDFKKTVEFIVNRRNTYTGVLYKEDKAIFGWETGNELQCPYSWNAEIARYVKSLDKNHLVIDGAQRSLVTEEVIKDPNIDVLSTHHYSRADASVKNIQKNVEMINGQKPYYIGEFGLVPPNEIKTVLDTAINNKDISGIMIWSLRFHNRDGGFYMHRENTGSGPYRYPGFASGDIYDEKPIINFMKGKAFEIEGSNLPVPEKPAAPTLLDIKDVYSISWQGTAGATSYNIERKETGGNWFTIAKNVSDAEEAYRPLFMDTTAVFGSEYYYRVTANNEAGSSDPSNEIGPVKVTFLKIVDELKNDSKIFEKDSSVHFTDYKDIYRVKEDNNRLIGSPGSYMIYAVPENLLSFKAETFLNYNAKGITIFAAGTLNNFDTLITKLETFPPYKNEYQFYTPASYLCEEFPAGTKYIKIVFDSEAYIGRVEIKYLGK